MQTKEMCDERTRHIESEIKGGLKRLDKHSEALDKLLELTTEIATINKNLGETIISHEKRILGLEERPGTYWDKVISAIISAVIAYLISSWR